MGRRYQGAAPDAPTNAIRPQYHRRMRLRRGLTPLLAALLGAAALSGCGHLTAVEVGVGYGGGWIEKREGAGPMVNLSIGSGMDRRAHRGYSCGIGGTVLLKPVNAAAGGGVFRWDGTLGTPDADAIGVTRWSFAIEGFAAGADGEDVTLGMAGFTGPTWAILTEEGMGIALSVGPWNLYSIHPAAFFGGQLRLKMTFGPWPGTPRGWC